MKRRSISIGIFGLLVILGLLGAASLVAGQEHQISGYVYEEGSYRTIDGAEVEIEGEGTWDTSYTDSSGYYSFWVQDGNYAIMVTASGFYDEDEWITVDGENVNQDFFLYEIYGDGNGGGGGGDGDDGDGNGDEDGDGTTGDFGELGDQVTAYATICGAFFIILMVSLLVMAIASVGIFMRLGKIKKELKNNQVGKTAQQPSYPAQQPQPQPVYNQPQQQPYTQPSQPQPTQAPPPPGPLQ